jgi:hypothetical protein
VDVVAPITSLLSAFGLSSAAGLNAYIPLLAVGLLSRFGGATLAEPYHALASTPILILLGTLALIDFVADKLPAVDHAVHAIGAIIHPVAGAIVFASQNSVLSNVHPALALGTGLVLAGGFHATRAAARPVATTTTAGVGNPIVSAIEDVVSLTLTLLALFAPVVAFVLLALLTIGVVRAWRAVRRWRGGGGRTATVRAAVSQAGD